MSYQNVVEAQIKNYKPNEIIVASELYNKRLTHIPEPTFYKALERMTKGESLIRLTNGIYCIPKITRFGTVKSSEKQVIEYYTGKHGEHGVVIGYGLYGKYGLTTQISKKTELYSNCIHTEQKTVGNVLVRRAELKMTPGERSMVETFEILEHYGKIENFDNTAFPLFLKSLAQQYTEADAINVQRVLRYRKKTIAFLSMILDSFNVRHGLRKMLSGTSSYKLPTMEKIYESAK